MTRIKRYWHTFVLIFTLSFPSIAVISRSVLSCLRSRCWTACKCRPVSSVVSATAFSATRWEVSSTSLLNRWISNAPARCSLYSPNAPCSPLHLYTFLRPSSVNTFIVYHMNTPNHTKLIRIYWRIKKAKLLNLSSASSKKVAFKIKKKQKWTENMF